MLFQPHWKLDGGRDAASLDDPEVGHPLEPFGHHDRDLQPGQVTPEAEVLAAAERQQALDGPVPDELVGVGVLALVAVGRAEQRDDPLARLDRGAVNGERLAHRSGEPLRRARSSGSSPRGRPGTLASRSARTAASWSGRRLSSHSPCATIFGTVSVPPMKTPSIWMAASMSVSAEPSGSR